MTDRSRLQVLRAGDVELDRLRYEVRFKGGLVQLERRPMDLLVLLMEHPGELVCRGDIARCLWGTDTFVEVDPGINTSVAKLRRAFRDDPERPRYIATVVGKGYRFVPEITTLDRGAGERRLGASRFRVVWNSRSVPLLDGDNIVGRDAGAAVCIDSSSVSRRHAVIRVDADHAVVEDLASKNGTRLNGRRLQRPAQLADGDDILIGAERLVFLAESLSGSTRTVLASGRLARRPGQPPIRRLPPS